MNKISFKKHVLSTMKKCKIFKSNKQMWKKLYTKVNTYLCHGPFSEFEFVTKIPILQTYLVLRQHFINSDKIGCNGISLNSSLTVWVDTSYRPLHSVWLQILPSVKYFPLIFHAFFHFLLSSIFLPYLITFWSSELLHL